MNRRFITTALVVCALLPAALPAFAQDKMGREGTFQGRNGITASGIVVVTDAGVSLMRDFKLEGATDARVGLGRNGNLDTGTDMGALQSAEGSQDYSAGRSFNVSDYNEVWIWNPADSTPLAVAKLN
ncbi:MULTISPECIES: hypothetical protein [Roseobacteraceae]|jgi:hypothetical protein|uniref:Twin-arginine translocation pathway signal protein n=1 Tax=Pseudosulfitobacter pseudonitzschiae TaxID=1402135 RepID=A0A221K476_9RHOB|nr:MULTISPECIES: hypothetical protein [Roseobacteraceae]ASM73799.1 twin-arginine translocation pathway signal protein [Pseudosulfitobacter pseudonitzschiae]